MLGQSYLLKLYFSLGILYLHEKGSYLKSPIATAQSEV